MKVLFVCGGNTCRSPMAAALAQKAWGPSVYSHSAGIAPHSASATADAIAVVRDRVSLDISDHRPCGLEPSKLKAYDYIVAMDLYVATRLRKDYQVPDSRLIKWQISDPYLQGREAYERCADDISQAMSNLRPMLLAAQQVARPQASGSEVPKEPKVAASLKALRADIDRWKAELESGQIRGTLLQGIVKKAVDSFEVVFRRCVECYRALAREEVPRSGKPFERLTLGELIQYLDQRNRDFTAACRRNPRGTEWFKNRRLLSGPFRKVLNKISVQRNRLHHHPHEFALDIENLHKNSRQLLDLLSEALTDAFFAFVEVVIGSPLTEPTRRDP